MELDAERIKSDLECCKFGKDKPNCEGCNYKPWIKPRCWHLLCHDALALITSQEQKIFELENRLKECENGYKGTNFFDRCKLHDAEEKVRKLTEENERLKEKADRNLNNLKAVLEERSENTIVADTVWKMHSMLCEGRVSNDTVVIVANQVAKEMLEEK